MAQQSYAETEGRRTADGGWEPLRADSPHRKLIAQEVASLEQYARTTTPVFGGPHNTKFEDHHPIAKDIWAARGIGSENNVK